MKFILSFVVSLSICVTFAADIPLRGKSTTDYHETDFTFSQNNIAYHMARFSELAYKNKGDLAKESADLSVEFQGWEIEKLNKKLLHGKQTSNGKTLHVYAFEGTNGKEDILCNSLQEFLELTPSSKLKAHQGFVLITKKYFIDEIILPETDIDYVILTGHSLGGAMANIVAARLAEGQSRIFPRTSIITFAAPSVFEPTSASWIDSSYPSFSHIRIANSGDIVPDFRERFRQTAEVAQNFGSFGQIMDGLSILSRIGEAHSNHSGQLFSLRIPADKKVDDLFKLMENARTLILPELRGNIHNGDVAIGTAAKNLSSLFGHEQASCYTPYLRVYNLVLAAKASEEIKFVIMLIGLLSIKQLVEKSQADA